LDSHLLIDGVSIYPIPVQHGYNPDGSLYLSMGFLFDNILYLSDVNSIPEASLKRIISSKSSIDILILDCLNKSGRHASHYCLDDCLCLIHVLVPKFVYFVGISHGWGDHDTANTYLRQLCQEDPLLIDISISIAFDGQCIELIHPTATAVS
jgi:phosphoribosyl 1,2-cyclic phosphodiesterase